MPDDLHISTARLSLRPPEAGDVDPLFAFLGDGEAMRFTSIQPTRDACAAYLIEHERWRDRNGCAPWVVIASESNRIAGYGGLYEDPFDPGWGVEVGYFFAPWAWGRGYASELVAACLDIARRSRRWPEITAFAHPENAASRRVLEKAGFREIEFVDAMNRHRFLWRLAPRPLSA